jgi:hypothetical protein
MALPESACGLPLGLHFHRASGDLYYADAYLGLMSVGRRGGLAEVVATEAGGAPLNFVNGVDVDQETGHIYFTESSATYQRRSVRLRVCCVCMRGCAVSFNSLLWLPQGGGACKKKKSVDK